MSLPIITFLYIYFFALAIFILGSIFILYHILRFGFNRKLIVFSTGIYLVISLLIILITASYLTKVDWSKSISFDIIPDIF